MKSYYDKLLEYLDSGNLEEALRCYEQWKVAGLLSPEEMETYLHGITIIIFVFATNHFQEDVLL